MCPKQEFRTGLLLFQDGYIARALRLHNVAETPSRFRNDRTDFGGRCKQIVEPFSLKLAVSNAYANLSTHPSPVSIPLLVIAVNRVAGFVGIQSRGDNRC